MATTGFTGAVDYLTGKSLPRLSYVVPSSGTLDLRAFDRRLVHVSGTATITAIIPPPYGECVLVFDGACLLTYNATSLILPSAANITTAAGDVMFIADEGNGNVRAINYIKASGLSIISDAAKANLSGANFTGAINEATEVTLASASTVNIGAAAANSIIITGNTTITAFDTIADGAIRRVRFTGALTLTYNATSLILPGAANITTAAGDVAEFISLGSGNWKCNYYNAASGLPIAQGFTLISSTTCSGATVNRLNDFSSNYDNYLIIGEGILPSAGDQFSMRFATGGSVDSGANYDYTSTIIDSGAAATNLNGAAAATIFKIAGNGNSSMGTGGAISFEMHLRNANCTGSTYPSASFTAEYYPNGTTTFTSSRGAVRHNNATALTGFSAFWFNGNNFSSGIIKVYGYRN